VKRSSRSAAAADGLIFVNRFGDFGTCLALGLDSSTVHGMPMVSASRIAPPSRSNSSPVRKRSRRLSLNLSIRRAGLVLSEMMLAQHSVSLERPTGQRRMQLADFRNPEPSCNRPRKFGAHGVENWGEFWFRSALLARRSSNRIGAAHSSIVKFVNNDVFVRLGECCDSCALTLIAVCPGRYWLLMTCADRRQLRPVPQRPST
jgi:hypothetical protein